jgi:hypothetical protein
VDEVRLLHAWRQYPEGPGSLFDFRDRHCTVSYCCPIVAAGVGERPTWAGVRGLYRSNRVGCNMWAWMLD